MSGPTTGQQPIVRAEDLVMRPKTRPKNRPKVEQPKTKSFPFMSSGRMADNKLNSTRIFEALLIAAVSAAGIWVTTVSKLETRVERFQEDVAEIKAELKALRQDFYVPNNRQPVLTSPQGNYYYLPKDDIKPDTK